MYSQKIVRFWNEFHAKKSPGAMPRALMVLDENVSHMQRLGAPRWKSLCAAGIITVRFQFPPPCVISDQQNFR